MECGAYLGRRGGRGLWLFVAAAMTALMLMLGASSASAAPVPNTALLLLSSTTPGTATDGSGLSLEQQQAQLDGFTVTAVDDPTWASMTAAQFAQYQVIIIGDPTCGDTVGPGTPALSNASTWEPVVMNSGGNKVLIGTDPTFHKSFGGAPNGDVLERNGIAYAGAVPGATGLYLDESCTWDVLGAGPGTPDPIMDGLSTHGPGQFTAVSEGFYSACATGVNIVALTGPTSGLTDADLSNWSCSVHEAYDSFPADWTPLALAPSSSGFPSNYCANDVGGNPGLACGAPYIMVSGGGVVVSSNISLSPPSQSQPTGGTATLTANVTANGTAVSGASVTFNVNSGPNTGQTFTGTTDSSGNVSWTYTDTGGAGTDSDSATYIDSSGNKQQATATVTWASTTDPPISAKGTNVRRRTRSICIDTAHFTDPDTAATASEYSATIDWGDGTSSAGTVIHPTSLFQFEVSGCHTYAAGGKYTVMTTITDVDNTANTATVTSTVYADQDHPRPARIFGSRPVISETPAAIRSSTWRATVRHALAKANHRRKHSRRHKSHRR